MGRAGRSGTTRATDCGRAGAGAGRPHGDCPGRMNNTLSLSLLALPGDIWCRTARQQRNRREGKREGKRERERETNAITNYALVSWAVRGDSGQDGLDKRGEGGRRDGGRGICCYIT